MSTLYLVERVADADDLTLRAARIMRTVSAIVTSNLPAARALLNECGIETPLSSLPDTQGLLDLLANGDVAWLDRTFDRPHTMLTALIAQGIKLEPLPGGVDEITALILSGLPTDRFAFYPDIPADLGACAREPYTLLFAITPEGWPTAVQSLLTALGNRRAALYHPGWTWRGRLADTPPTLTAPAVLVVEGTDETSPTWEEETVREALRRALAEDIPLRQAVQTVAGQSGWSRRRVYALAVALQQEH